MSLRRPLFWTILALCGLACRSVPPAPRRAAPAAAPACRVVLLSLDGAGADELHRLYREGALSAGGFARFFQEGQVADRLVPVNPALTATNHVSLVTGYAADRTGIVGNTFHLAGTPFLDTVSGFAAPIGTETLWEAARRQGKRTGVVGWRGAHDPGPRRRGDWGMAYVNEAYRASDLVTVERAAWKPVAEPARLQGVESRSPVLGARVDAGGAGEGRQSFDLLAVDRTDDGKVDYDGLVIVPSESANGSRPAPSAPPELLMPLTPGHWLDLPCQFPGEAGSAPSRAVCPVKLLSLAPDLGGARLYFGGAYPLRAYPDELNAGLAAKGLFWPGAPDDRSLNATWLGRPGIDLATWSEEADRFTRFFADSLIALAGRSDWDLLLGYIPTLDEAGHELLLSDPRQPGFSPERRDACAAARRQAWQSVDRELARLLGALDLRTTIVAVVSDHGMTPAYTLLDANVLLRDQGLLAADDKGKILEAGTAAYAVPGGGMINVYLAPGQDSLLPRLRDLFTGWTVAGERPVELALTRREAAAIQLDSPNSGDLVVFLREGFTSGSRLREGKISSPPTNLGVHGYLNTHPDMHGIYLALGPGIVRGNAGTVQNPAVAGRVANWLGIGKPRPAP
jgi:predicted AlkP superfamily pyrophosphatase or phosphodiesterase